jgi:thiosulfate dehydrogenase [quinone] large subunit
MTTERFGLGRRLPGWPLALFRIAYGLLFLDMAWQKAPWVGYGWLRGFIEKEIASPAFGWYAAFLRDVVLPNFTLFAFVTFVVELSLGVALFLGVLTRLAGAGGFLWQVQIALGAFNVPGEWYWIWPLLTLPLFCFAFTGAGRVLGVDHWLEPELERRALEGATWARWLWRAV